MPSLREVKDRIGSVRSTLKITSAMKLVASSKLRKAQRAIENLRPYAEALDSMLAAAGSVSENHGRPRIPETAPASATPPAAATVILAFAGNTSMCGAFNANAIKRTIQEIDARQGTVEVWAFGRKMAEALRKAGRPAARDYSHLIGNPEFDAVAAISTELQQMAAQGRIGGVEMVYNHFVSTGKQVVVCESFLGGWEIADQVGNDGQDAGNEIDFIIEPSKADLLEALRPQVMNMRLYAALLDSVASEHAARMIAMQTATDNAEELLSELTLEYNKGRQQKITAEILDLVAGEA